MTRLTPSFARVALRVVIVFLVISILGYFQQGYSEGKWWTSGYMLTMAIPLAVMLIFVWFAFVPKKVEYSDSEITISTLLGESTYAWETLYAFGRGNGVFKLQFVGDRQPYQIFVGAYPKGEWEKLVAFMKMRFPECEQAYSIGVQ